MSQQFDDRALPMDVHQFCVDCGAEVLFGGDLCPGCEHQANGMCRWCGEEAPAIGQDVCLPCAEINDLIREAGSAENANLMLRFRLELDALPTFGESSEDIAA